MNIVKLLNLIFFNKNKNSLNEQKFIIKKNKNKTKNFKISQQIENFFLYMMLKSMKKNICKNEAWINTQKESIYQDMYDHIITQIYSKKSIGLAKIINKQISQNQNESVSNNDDQENLKVNKNFLEKINFYNITHNNDNIANYINAIKNSKLIY
ncbi:MAG: rod-binding protein [Buchnera aphidicola (Chaetogeoica yunlongensis)]